MFQLLMFTVLLFSHYIAHAIHKEKLKGERVGMS